MLPAAALVEKPLIIDDNDDLAAKAKEFYVAPDSMSDDVFVMPRPTVGQANLAGWTGLARPAGPAGLASLVGRPA